MRVTQSMKEHVEGLHKQKNIKPTLETVMWAVIHYFDNSPCALQELIEGLGADQRPGDITKQYFVNTSAGEMPVSHKDVLFYTGVLVGGRPHPLRDVVAENAPEDMCHECGVMAPCTKSISDDGTVVACNHCRTYLAHGHDARFDRGSLEVCQVCPKRGCSNHPYNANNILKLPASAQSAQGL